MPGSMNTTKPRTIIYTRVANGDVKMVPLLDTESKDEEAAAEYRRGGYLPITVGDKFSGDRYIVVRKLGWGHFSTVWLVRDTVYNRHCAVKVVKSAQRYTETALDEIKLLKQIASTVPGHPGHKFVVKLLDSFDHVSRGDIHICMVMEPLGETLLTLVEKNRKTGIPQNAVKSIISQVLQGLAFLHDCCDLVHTDIKPENILISIPDVEDHIRSELLSSPTPSSRHVGIPIDSQRVTSTVARRLDRARDRVRIFDSQPLPSPSNKRSPLGRSPSEHLGLLMSSMKIANNGSPHSTSGENSLNTSLGGGGLSTAPTSLGSVAPKALLSTQTSLAETKSTDQLISRIMTPNQSLKPSLLSQTAPVALQVLDHPLSKDASLSLSTSEFNDTPTQNGIFLSPPHLPELPKLIECTELHIKIADLGNATPSKSHFTEDIQTRQYRAPEAILGRSDWDAKVDIWSVACVIFELLTGDLLFDPQSRPNQFSKDDDHMAMIIELLGDDFEFDYNFKMGGKYSRDMFNSQGELRYVSELNKWPLRRVMIEKYLWQPGPAQALCDFLLPMLAIHPQERPSASQMSQSEWLVGV